MQRKSQLVVDNQLVGGGILRGLDEGTRNARGLGCGDDLGIIGIQDQIALSVVEFLLILHGSSLSHAIGVVEDNTQVAQTANAGLRADRRLANLNTRVAQRALLSLTG